MSLHNDGMGGVGKCDFRISIYRSSIRSGKWTNFTYFRYGSSIFMVRIQKNCWKSWHIHKTRRQSFSADWRPHLYYVTNYLWRTEEDLRHVQHDRWVKTKIVFTFFILNKWFCMNQLKFLFVVFPCLPSSFAIMYTTVYMFDLEYPKIHRDRIRLIFLLKIAHSENTSNSFSQFMQLSLSHSIWIWFLFSSRTLEKKTPLK